MRSPDKKAMPDAERETTFLVNERADAGKEGKSCITHIGGKKQQGEIKHEQNKNMRSAASEDIAAVNEARPDPVGFIVNIQKADGVSTWCNITELVRGLLEKIIPVGVFVNAPKELVAELSRRERYR